HFELGLQVSTAPGPPTLVQLAVAHAPEPATLGCMKIEREIEIEAPEDVVWRTITEPDQISQWFADKVDLEIKPGAHGYLGFGDQGGPVVVEAVEPPTRFSFRWNHPTGEEPVAG